MVYLKLNKKGVVYSTLTKIILIVIIAGILILFLSTKLGPWMRERTDKEICRLSVLATSKIKPGGKPITGLKCKTQEAIIDGKNVDDMNEQIANLMYNCWWQFGEGKLNIAPERWINPFSKKHCFVCSIFEFSDDAKKIYKEKTLSSWMNEHEIPSKKITYEKYFKEIQEKDYVIIDTTVDPNKKYYAIIFISSESNYLKNVLNKITKGEFAEFMEKMGEPLFMSGFFYYRKFKEWITGEKEHIWIYGGREGLLMLPLEKENVEEVCDVLE